jgi:hypothetical protein
VILVAIEAHRRRKHRVFSARSVDIALWSIRFVM